MADLFIIALAFCCTLIPLYGGARWGLVAWVSPLHILAYLAAAGFLAKALAYATAPDLAFYARFEPAPGAVLRGAIYLGLFILLITLGYGMACRPLSRRLIVVATRIKAGQLRHGLPLALGAGCVTLLTIALILRARGAGWGDAGLLASLNSAKQIAVNADGVGATLAGIKTFFVVPKYAFILSLAALILQPGARLALITGALALLLVAVALVSGDRFDLVELAVYALASYALMGGRIGLRGGLAMLLAGILLALVAGQMTQLRGAEAGLGAQILGSSYFLDLNIAVMVTDRVSPDLMLGGQSYFWWLYGWVPRAIWPDKPAVDLGVYLKQVVMGEMAQGGYNVTGPGEAFINFGWGGLLMAPLLGAVFRWGEAFLLQPARNLAHGTAFLYPLLFYPFVQASLQSSFSAYLVGAMAQLLVVLALRPVVLARGRGQVAWA
jgi:oligosaccharide repeat unit polymerase